MDRTRRPQPLGNQQRQFLLLDYRHHQHTLCRAQLPHRATDKREISHRTLRGQPTHITRITEEDADFFNLHPLFLLSQCS